MSRKNRKTIFPGMPVRLRQVRGELTQAEFGKKIGVTQGAVQKYEKGINYPNYVILKNIADYGSVSMEWLLRGEEPANPKLEEFAPEPYESRPPEPVESYLLFLVIGAVEGYFKGKRLEPSLRGKARLIAKVYSHCSQEFAKPDHILVEKYFLLTDY